LIVYFSKIEIRVYFIFPIPYRRSDKITRTYVGAMMVGVFPAKQKTDGNKF